MKNTFILFLTAVAMIACQQNSNTAPGGPQGPKPGAPGTIDSGGQHGTEEGLPLDRYRINDMSSLPEVSLGIYPMLDNLYRIDKDFAGHLLHILRQRSWFILPAKLDDIPSRGIGAYFPTVQIAVHRMREIWIDQKRWKPLNDFDRRMILAHEMIMGVVFLKFQRPIDQCLARWRYFELPIGADPTNSKYDVARRDCLNTYRLDFVVPSNDSKLELSEHDYTVIRKLTSMLVNQNGEINKDELELMLLEIGVRAPAPPKAPVQTTNSQP